MRDGRRDSTRGFASSCPSSLLLLPLCLSSSKVDFPQHPLYHAGGQEKVFNAMQLPGYPASCW
ncbi:hypothetical protein AURDEDRAFT_110300 [Auricularia subglabra TFB-10046 SS5]|nr:hypothetical protein AURDEDRAFT_110300 [Auricularia subglabra TFB-10046 SS5]